MQRPTPNLLRVGDWCVNPRSSQISRNGESSRIETRTMRLLLALAERPGQVVSIDQLLSDVWPDVTVSSDSVYQAVTSLRRLLGDDPRQPAYIETVPRLGYRMIAPVQPWSLEPSPLEPSPQDSAPPAAATPAPGRWRIWLLGGAAVLAMALVAAFVARPAPPATTHSAAPNPPPPQSIAVLPFLDLTPGMQNGEFADGITEELIDKLSKVPGLRVPAPTASFYYKEKQLPIADIARALGVAYVLDGSVRKSGTRVRVSARLVRADNGYVAWTEDYDRSFHDLLWVQDDIAGEVAKALSASPELKTR